MGKSSGNVRRALKNPPSLRMQVCEAWYGAIYDGYVLQCIRRPLTQRSHMSEMASLERHSHAPDDHDLPLVQVVVINQAFWREE